MDGIDNKACWALSTDNQNSGQHRFAHNDIYDTATDVYGGQARSSGNSEDDTRC